MEKQEVLMRKFDEMDQQTAEEDWNEFYQSITLQVFLLPYHDWPYLQRKIVDTGIQECAGFNIWELVLMGQNICWMKHQPHGLLKEIGSSSSFESSN
ncbi:hypothetical protein F0562_002504 [Nyssa sinensis]|uniref:Uncharacterized protein n=1 Tax=Nyssa sinensis TaxID=561372 RepID=A0A5J5C9T2_9ASTE|nr:hypothetical protein F0562_002504 [Nyssa sinensis]